MNEPRNSAAHVSVNDLRQENERNIGLAIAIRHQLRTASEAVDPVVLSLVDVLIERLANTTPFSALDKATAS